MFERPPYLDKPARPKWPIWVGAGVIVILIICVGFAIVIRNLFLRFGIGLTRSSAIQNAPTVSFSSPSVNPTLTQITGTSAPNERSSGDATEVSERDRADMVYVPAGDFLMGSTNSDSSASADEKPQRIVYLDAYWIHTYEVSNDMFSEFVTDTGYETAAERQGYSYMYTSSGSWGEFAGVNWRHPMGASTNADGSLPVVHVNFYDASVYCEWAGGLLPTEAEWEKAARGEDGRIFPWGNKFDSSLLRYDASGGPVSIDSYPGGQSPYGVYNMAGNVFEWTGDWYSASYYEISPGVNPAGPSSGDLIALRSGGWNSSQSNVRTANRDVSGPEYMNHLLGFRCVFDGD